MKYKEQSEKLIQDTFRENWYTEEEWAEVESCVDYEQLDKDIDVGLSNGYSIEEQFDLFRKVAKVMKKLKS